MLKNLLRRRDDEKGFTLIELMVVVLILGILMAIAIPTFLSTKGSAQDAGAKSNASNALTVEKTYFGDNQGYTTGVTSLDANLPWAPSSTLTKGQVSAAAADATGPSNSDLAIEITSFSPSGNCFFIYDSQDANTAGFPAGTAYYELQNQTSCTFPGAPTAMPAAGTSAGAKPGNWAAAW